LDRHDGDAVLRVHAEFPADLELGESIATNGVCLTVREIAPSGFVADLSQETLARTTLGSLRARDRIHLERSLRVGDRVSGHFVFGHVDTVGRIAALDREGDGLRLTVEHPGDFAVYVADKGSVAIDGVSLTVCDPAENRFSIALVPHTIEMTTLAERKPGDEVNLEADMLARYARRAIETIRPAPGSELRR
jgi:riboflavin synthase